MIKSVLTLAVFGLFSPLTHAEAIVADCFFIGGQSSESSGSAVITDPVFAAQNGLITLNENKVSQRVGFGTVEYSLWTAKQRIQLGHGYAIMVYIQFQTQKPFGDFVQDHIELKTNSTLLFKGTAVGVAATRSTEPVQDRSGKKNLNIELDIENLPLRNFLGAIDSPELDLNDLVDGYHDRHKLYSDYGDSKGVLLRANVNCSVPLP